MIAAPPGSTPRKISALARAIAFDALEEFEMHRLDGGDDRDVRAHHPRQRRDLAGVVHADLEDAEARARRHARQRQRHAPVVVERGRRVVRRPVGASAAASISLVPVLPTLPVTAAMRAVLRARAARPRSASAVEHVVDDGQRALDPAEARRGAPRRPPRSRRRAASAGATKSWPSRLSPLMAKKASPGATVRLSIEMPAIASGARAERAAAASPRRSRRRSRAARLMRPPRRRARRATRVVVGERDRPRRRRSGRSRGPCRRCRARRPARASRSAAAIASPRSPISIASGRAVEDRAADRGRVLRARIVVGDDDDVGVARRPPCPSAAACRDRGRRRRRRRRSSRPVRHRAERLQRARQRIRLVGVVDEDHRAVRLVADELEPARRAFEVARARRARRRRAMPAPMASPAATSAFDAWKAPASGSSTSSASAEGLDARGAGGSRSARQSTSRSSSPARADADQPSGRARAAAATTCAGAAPSMSTTAVPSARQDRREEAELGGEIVRDASGGSPCGRGRDW